MAGFHSLPTCWRSAASKPRGQTVLDTGAQRCVMLGEQQECGYLGRTEWFQNPWEGNIVWVVFWDGIRDSETVHSQVLRGEEIKYIITALGNINSEKSCISFWFKYSLQSKLPKAPWQSKLIFRRIKDLQHHILSLEQLCDDPFPNLAVKLGPVPFQNHLLCSSLPPVTQRGFGVTQPYLLCQSALPAWSAFPAGRIFLSCACWISSCPCRLPLPLPRSSAAASPWQQPRPAAWLIMQNRTVTPELYPFLSSVLILSDPASTTGAAWDSLCQGHPWLPGEPGGSAGHGCASTSLRTRGDLGWKALMGFNPHFYPHPWCSGPYTYMPLNVLQVTWQVTAPALQHSLHSRAPHCSGFWDASQNAMHVSNANILKAMWLHRWPVCHLSGLQGHLSDQGTTLCHPPFQKIPQL